MSSRPVVQFLAAAGLVAVAGVLWTSVPGGDDESDPFVQVLDGVPATAIICHERRYPELVRIPVMAGAQIVFHLNAGMDTLAVSRTKRRGRDGIAHFIEFGPHRGALIGRDIAHPGTPCGDTAFFSPVANPEFLKGGIILNRSNFSEGGGGEGLELVNHGKMG